MSAAIASEPWGEAHGEAVRLWELTSGDDLRVRITNYGGVVQSIWVPDREGRAADVVLGHPQLEDYVADFELEGGDATYFGAIVGRYANRIAGHSFELDGESHELPGNNGPGNVNTLHGGPRAWSTKVWEAREHADEEQASLRLSYVDPDGANGFPGQVSAEVTYTVTRRGALRIDYEAEASAPTVINLTNHSYFNLAGEGSGDVYGHMLQINARRFLPADETGIPTGAIAAVSGTPFDFRALKPIGLDLRSAAMPEGEQLRFAHGYDHHFLLDGTGLRLGAIAIDPASGRQLLVYTTEPGVQFYSANFLLGDLAGPSGRAYRAGDAFALETQHAPDSPHHAGEPEWPSVQLAPGEVFRSTTVFRFAIA